MSAEAKRRFDAFLSELWASEAWDSEFTPNPHSPGTKLDRLLELGAEAVEPLVGLLADRDKSARWWAARGLRTCGHLNPAVALPALAAVPPGDFAEGEAITAIAMTDASAYFALPADRRAVRSLCDTIRAQGSTAQWLGAFLDRADDTAAALLLDGLTTGAATSAVLTQVTRALLSPSEAVRAKASKVLSRSAQLDAEARLEAMVVAGVATSVEDVAWHPRSDVLIPLLIAKGNARWLAELVYRRRAAGLATEVTPALFAFLEAKLLRPDRSDFRFREHDVHDAARAVKELGEPRLVPALVACVGPDNAGYAWNSVVGALRSFRDRSLELLRARPQSVDQVRWAIEALEKHHVEPSLDWADQAFIEGKIDDDVTANAFGLYASCLRPTPSPAAAFQLAWLDRAFGATITSDRLAWVRALGVRDEALLAELALSVVALTGYRSGWRKCETQAQAERALAAGLPGLAWTKTRSEAHQAAARAHVERVHRAAQP